MSGIFFVGDVSERPKVQLSKSCVGESPPWVQIPPSPPFWDMNKKVRSASLDSNGTQ